MRERDIVPSANNQIKRNRTSKLGREMALGSRTFKPTTMSAEKL